MKEAAKFLGVSERPVTRLIDDRKHTPTHGENRDRPRVALFLVQLVCNQRFAST